MTPRQLPDLHKDETFAKLAKNFVLGKTVTDAIDALQDVFKEAFANGFIKGAKGGYATYCKEHDSFDYITEECNGLCADLWLRLPNDAHARDTIKRVYYDLQLDFLDKALHDLFIEGAQYGLTKGYEMGEHGNKNKR